MPAVALDIEFPLHVVGSLSNVRSAVLRQAEYAHELLIIDCFADIHDLRSNVPVQATLGAVGMSIDFVGYVHHVRDRPSKHSGMRGQRIVCIGPTWRMRQPRQRVWQDLTASEIVLRILGEYQLTGDVQATTVRLPHKVQSAESDWDFICRLARENGFVVYPRATLVHFHERKSAEAQKVGFAPIFHYRADDVGYADDEVREFLPVLGEDMPHREGSKASRVVRGVDPRTAQMIAATHDGRPDHTRRADNVQPLFAHAHTDMVVNSDQIAQGRVLGKSGVAMWQHRADADTMGDVTVEPSGFVYIASVPGHYAGFWAVVSVDHVFRDNQYRLQMHLGTDALGVGADDYVPPATPLAYGSNVVSTRSAPSQALLVTPGNFGPIDVKRAAGGPAPLAWRGSVATATDHRLAKTSPDTPATLVARARRFKNSGR